MATPLGVEVFTVVTGPLRLLEENPKPIKADSYLTAAAAFQAGLEKQIEAFLKAGDKTPPAGDPPPQHDYFETNRKVSRAAAEVADVGRVAQVLERWGSVCAELPDAGLGAAYAMRFKRTVEFLHATLPRRTFTTLAGGIQPTEPPSLEMSPFWRALEAIEDPRVLMRDMREHVLVSDQVEATKQLYPEIYAVMTGAMLQGMAERRTADQGWEPTLRQGQQIETLLLTSRLSPDLAAELQERARLAEQAQRSEEQQGSRSGGGSSDPGDRAQDYQTSTQRVSYR